MIQVIPIKHNIQEKSVILRSHVLNPRLHVTITLTIQGKKENIISILEDHLLETISSVEWNSPDMDTDFAFLTENYNRFIRNLEPKDLVDVSVMLSLLRDNMLIISAIGNATAYLVEGDEISQIVSPDRSRFDFHTLTTGEVSRNSVIYLSNADSLEILGNDFLLEFSVMNSQEFTETTQNLFERELDTSLHLIRVAHSFKAPNIQKRHRGRGQLDLFKEKGKALGHKIQDSALWKQMQNRINTVDFGVNEKQKYGFIVAGVTVVFLLLFVLFRAVSGLFSGDGFSSDVYAQKVKEAQTLVANSATLKGNHVVFNENMQKAESLLAELKTAQKYLPDVATIQGNIDALKKEVYGIETLDLSKQASIVPVTGADFTPVTTFEVEKKLMVIGEKGMVVNYVRDTPEIKVIPYPNQEKAIGATIVDAGIPYIITDTPKMLAFRNNSVQYASSMKKDTELDLGKKIKTYRDNLYVVSPEQTQIYQYSSGVNGFKEKVNKLPQLMTSKILDIAVDGGFYILTEDGKIQRFASGQSGVTSLVLNKIPGAWTVDPTLSTEIIASHKLSYVYIRNGRTLWIFKPNSKNYKDINALEYVAQIQIQSEKDISNISVPRDGQIYITTENGVFEAQFQVSDDKFFLTVQ